MFKKLSLALIAVLALALVFGGMAWADEGLPPAQTATPGTVRWGGGEVTAVGSNNFTVQNRFGRGPQIIYVNSGTQFTDNELNAISFGDLKVGDRVFGAAKLADDGKWYAVLVHVFPLPTHYAGIGKVNSVEDNEFSFTNRQGKQWDFYVDASTQVYEEIGRAHV